MKAGQGGIKGTYREEQFEARKRTMWSLSCVSVQHLIPPPGLLNHWGKNKTQYCNNIVYIIHYKVVDSFSMMSLTHLMWVITFYYCFFSITNIIIFKNIIYNFTFLSCTISFSFYIYIYLFLLLFFSNSIYLLASLFAIFTVYCYYYYYIIYSWIKQDLVITEKHFEQ